MGRKSGKRKVLRIRFRDDLGIPQTRLVVGNKPSRFKASFNQGRVLKISKVSHEELFHVGAYNKLPEQLMKEFRGRKGGESSIERKLNVVARDKKSEQEVENV